MDDTPTPIAELDHGPSKFEIFLEENQKLLIAGAIAIFLGVLGYVGFTSFAEMKAAEAGEALASAEQDEQFQAVLAQFPESASAGSAALLLANNQADESNQAAIDALQDFIASYPNHPALATATTNLGLRLLNEGKFDEAQDQLSTVEDIPGSDYIAPIATIGLGDIAKQKGDLDLAKQHYEAVSNLVAEVAGDSTLENINKFAAYTQMANTRLRFLNAKAPAEVEKKTSPAAEPATTPEAEAGTADAPASSSDSADAGKKVASDEEINEKNSQSAE